MIILVNDVSFQKAFWPISVTLTGITVFFNKGHNENEYFSILFNLFEILIVSNETQFWNA